MDTARNYLALLMGTFVVSLATSALRPSRKADAAAGISWLACLALIVLGVPMAAAADFGIFGSDQEGDSGSSTGASTQRPTAPYRLTSSPTSHRAAAADSPPRE